MSNHKIILNHQFDKSNMQLAIKQFPEQISESFQIMSDWDINRIYENIHNILIIGMGGSAIGGDVAKALAQNDCKLPILVNRSYNIPEWVSENTLIIASSYSGSTEETLSAYKQCRDKKCSIIVLTTGGDIGDYADKFHLDKIVIPSGYQPRAALGFSFTLILILLNKLGFIKESILKTVRDTVEPLKDLSKKMIGDGNSALTFAKQIYKTCPIIYGSQDLTWVAALRFRGQLAENSKMLSFHNNFPEQNHNEIEGWTCNENIMSKLSIIWLKDKADHFGVESRMRISSELLFSKPCLQLNIEQSGDTRSERLLKIIHFTDWISFYAALLNEVDPTPVKRIQELKSKILQEK